MHWTAQRRQPGGLVWAVVLVGLLAAGDRLRAGEPVGPGPGGAVATTGRTGAAVTAQAPAVVASGPARGGQVVRSGPAPAQAAQRNGRVQNEIGVREQATINNQGTVRGTAGAMPARNGTVGVRLGSVYQNAWMDPARRGQQPRGYYNYRPSDHQSGSHHHRRPLWPYLQQYYAGYYPVYIDVPLSTYYDVGPYLDYNLTDADSGDGGGATAAPANITVAPQNDVQPANPPESANAAQTPPANDDDQAARQNIGPDSLVEAVQTELAKRGYFQGQVDSMFRADTQAALRRFQQDNYLATTGHLNEPTLHALNLD